MDTRGLPSRVPLVSSLLRKVISHIHPVKVIQGVSSLRSRATMALTCTQIEGIRGHRGIDLAL
jgi:hypothetical protein